MESAGKLREHYSFTENDAKNLSSLKEMMEAEKLRVGDELYRFIVAIPEIAALVTEDETVRRRHRAGIGRWFSELFSGRYDQAYFANLQRVGATHVRIGLQGHYVNAAMNLVRDLCRDIIGRKMTDRGGQEGVSRSLDKMLDMNLDVITSSYREAELRKVFLSYRLDEALMRFAERFSFALKIILVIALMGISLAVVGLFVGDVVSLFRHRTAHGVLGALGSLLIIWVMVELMENEIRQLRGGSFKIQVFLGVALVALIRELLIASLEHDAGFGQIYILAGIVSLGVVYWLISRAEAVVGRK